MYFAEQSLVLTICSTKCDDGTLFLGDGSLAGVPTPKLGGKGIRPVIKVVDDKCLYVRSIPIFVPETDRIESLTHRRTIQSISFLVVLSQILGRESRTKHLHSIEFSMRTRPRLKYTRQQQEVSWTAFWMDIMQLCLHTVQPVVERPIQLLELLNSLASFS